MDKTVKFVKKFYDDLGKTVQPAHIQLTGHEQLDLFFHIIKSISKSPESAQEISFSLGYILRSVDNDPEMGADVFIEGINGALKLNCPDAQLLPRYMKPMLVNILKSTIRMKISDYIPEL